MTIRNLAIISLASLITSACTQANVAQAEVYQIDASHTHVQFSVDRFGFNDVIGTFRNVEGTITLDKDAPENSAVNVVITASSVDSGNSTRDGHVKGRFWIQAEEFPLLTYRSTRVDQTSETEATVTGDLTFLSVTRPVILQVTLNRIGEDPSTKAEAAGFSATATINRSDWDLTTATGMVGDEVTIRIETLAVRVEEDAKE